MLLRFSASTNLPVGDVCDLDYATVDGLLCHPSLICASCPGDPGETFCQTRTGGYLSLSQIFINYYIQYFNNYYW